MKVDTFKCDSCGNIKGTGNHWFRLVVDDDDSKEPFCAIHVWEGGQAGLLEKHLCSDQCVVKVVQQWLSAQKEASREVASAAQSE